MSAVKSKEISIEARMVLACARAHLRAAELSDVVELSKSPTLDWTKLITFAQAHGVLPLLANAVGKANPQSIPQEIAQKLRDEARRVAQHNLLLVSELIKLIAAFRAADIRILPYKGPLLAMFGYGDFSLRQSGDLDVLVPEHDVQRAKDLLVSLGYEAIEESDAAAATEEASALEYHFTYARKDRGVIVELHWQVVGDSFSFKADTDTLWENSITAKLMGKDIRVPSDEDLLIILCAHGMKHFWTRLGWICDLAEFIRARPNINWQQLVVNAELFGGLGITLVGLLLAHKLLDAPLPAIVLDKARPALHRQAEQLKGHLFDPAADLDDVRKGARMQLAGGGVFASLLLHVRSRDNWTSGLRYCLHRLFTPTKMDSYAASLPRPLRPVYYLMRPLRLALKYGPRAVAGWVKPRVEA